ncbi:hypothetical protein GH733_011568, partial [Mirounga leonina]
MPGIRIHGRCHGAARPHNLPAWSTHVWLLGQEGAGVGGHELPGGQWPSGAWGCPAVTLPVPSWPKWVVARPTRGPAGRALRPSWGCPELGGILCCPVSSSCVSPMLSPAPQYIDAISNKQGELENYVSDGYKTALTEERRRFCFLVEKQCAVAKNSAAYHSKGKELLAQKLPLWQQACADPNKIPDRAVQLMQQMAGSNGSILPSTLSASKSSLVISDPIPGAKPLPVPPELAPFVGRLSAQESTPVMNGVSGPDGEDYSPWADRKAAQPKTSSPPQSQSKLSDSYSNTLPVRKSVAPKNSYAATENKTLPRSSSMAAGLERNGRMRVKAIFSHAAGDNSTLLSFKEGDLITLLVPEARDGWHYGESEKTKMRGWFPFSYTRVLDGDGSDRLHMSLQQGKSSSTGNLLDKEELALPPPDYGAASRAFPAQAAGTFKQRPYSVAVPAFSQVTTAPDRSPRDVCVEGVIGGCVLLVPLSLSSYHAWSAAGQMRRCPRSRGLRSAGCEQRQWHPGVHGVRTLTTGSRCSGEPPHLSGLHRFPPPLLNPFANVQLKPTVTNDRECSPPPTPFACLALPPLQSGLGWIPAVSSEVAPG